MTLDEAKSDLRSRLRAGLKTIPAVNRAEASVQVCARLAGHKLWDNARSILFFAPMTGELDIWPLVSQALTVGKLVALPRFSEGAQAYVACQIENLEADIQMGRYGIREPVATCAEVPLNRLDLVLVPGVAFDAHGRRLGRGRGFYDRLLAGVRGTKCGIAFDEQIVGEVPAGPQDIHINCILTPTRWIET